MADDLKIAVVGDIHLQFNEDDIAFFNQSDYHYIIFVGDLPSRDPGKAAEVAARMGRVKKPAFYIPGNHDGITMPQLAGELLRKSFLIETASMGMQTRVQKIYDKLRHFQICGYNSFNLAENLALVAVRPFSMGGAIEGSVNFAPYLRKHYAVSTMKDSQRLLEQVIDKVKEEKILFLGHHGPFGLGRKPSDIWGVDFNRKGGDFGDMDYAHAIEYAQKKKKTVLLAMAGHMHYPTKFKQKPKFWYIEKDSVKYVNAAKFPRIESVGGIKYHHHVRIEIGSESVKVAAAFVHDDFAMKLYSATDTPKMGKLSELLATSI